MLKITVLGFFVCIINAQLHIGDLMLKQVLHIGNSFWLCMGEKGYVRM